MIRSVFIASTLILLNACAAPVAVPVADPLSVANLEQVWLAEGFESPEGAAVAPKLSAVMSSARTRRPSI